MKMASACQPSKSGKGNSQTAVTKTKPSKSTGTGRLWMSPIPSSWLTSLQFGHTMFARHEGFQDLQLEVNVNARKLIQIFSTVLAIINLSNL